MISQVLYPTPTKLKSVLCSLAFLLLIGVALVADGFEFHIPRGYIYFAMAFAGGVEAVNIIAFGKKKKKKPAA